VPGLVISCEQVATRLQFSVEFGPASAVNTEPSVFVVILFTISCNRTQ